MLSLILYLPLMFLVLFSTVITSLGKRELVYMLLVHLYVYLACVTFCLFLFHGGWRRIVIVALPGLFI